jgi:hypothetical protein
LPFDHATFRDIQSDIRQAVVQVDAHMQRENGFMMEAFNTDVGVGE